MPLHLSNKNIFLNPSTVQTAVLVRLMKDRRWKLLTKKWEWLALCTPKIRWQRCWCFQSHHAGWDYESHQQHQLDPAAIWALTSGRWFSARRVSACMKGSSPCAAYQSDDPWTLLSTSLWKWRVNMTKATACSFCTERRWVKHAESSLKIMDDISVESCLPSKGQRRRQTPAGGVPPVCPRRWAAGFLRGSPPTWRT